MAIDAETARRMLNWAMWRNGVPVGVALSSAYDLEARGRREEVSIPLLNGEAIDVDKAVHELPEELQDAVEQYWCKPGTTDQKARRLRCSVRTMFRRVDHGHFRIRSFLESLKARGERARAALNGGKTPLLAVTKSV